MLASLAGHALTGLARSNEELAEHHQPTQTLGEYLIGGEFLSTPFENCENEFLQMGLFVLLTVSLRQKGASESRPLDPSEETPPQRVPRNEQRWPVRRGGVAKALRTLALQRTAVAVRPVEGGARLQQLARTR